MKYKKKYINALNNILNKRKWIIAYIHDVPILFHESELDKVVESYSYIQPIEVARFTSYERAIKRIKYVEVGSNGELNACYVGVDFASGEDFTGYQYEY